MSFANDMPYPNPLQAPKTFADVQSGDALMVVVECVRPPRRRTLCRRRDLVIIQAAAFGSTPLQAELVQEHLVRRGRFSPAAQARIVVRASFFQRGYRRAAAHACLPSICS